MFRVIKIFEVFPVDGLDKEYGTLSVPSTGACLYGSGKIIQTNKQQLYTGLKNGELQAVDIFGQNMTTDDMTSDILYLGDEAEAYNMISPVYQVNWNIRICAQLVSYVRGEMLAESLSAMGLSATGMLTKLKDVVFAIQVGMFKEAWQMLQYQVARDAFLTEERLGKYIKMLKAADVIDYTIPTQN